MKKVHDVIVIGAGPAGLGVARKLQELEIDCLVLEKGSVGESFLHWSDDTRFITPSFPSNAFGQIDLNSIDGVSSPGIIAEKEHVSGEDFAGYLQGFVAFYNLNVSEQTEGTNIKKTGELFEIETNRGTYTAKYICFATGEFSFPSYGAITGNKYSLHSSQFKNAKDYKESSGVIPVIGGYESAIDVADSLIKAGKKVHIFCSEVIDSKNTTDPSRRLSLYSLERYKKMKASGVLTVTVETIETISKNNDEYTLQGIENTYTFSEQPITATGFNFGGKVLGDFASYNADGFPVLNSVDELEKTNNIFIAGPGVRHEDLIFCFIYKYRLRFGVVALEIAKRLGKELDYELIKQTWEKQGFYLNDFSCCGDECVC